MNLSDRIQSLRKIRGMSQEELADRVGVTRQAVSKWESEQSMPDLDKVIAGSRKRPGRCPPGQPGALCRSSGHGSYRSDSRVLKLV